MSSALQKTSKDTAPTQTLSRSDKIHAYINSNLPQLAAFSLFIAILIGCAITTSLVYKGKGFNLTDLNSFKHVDIGLKVFWGATAGTFLLSLIFLRPNSHALHKEYKKILAKRTEKARVDNILKQYKAELSATEHSSNEALKQRIQDLETRIANLKKQEK